jgi:hypothetical protein
MRWPWPLVLRRGVEYGAEVLKASGHPLEVDVRVSPLAVVVASQAGESRQGGHHGGREHVQEVANVLVKQWLI